MAGLFNHLRGPLSIAELTVLQFIVYRFVLAIYNLYFHPLRNFPGPKLWAISRLPSQYHVLSGHAHLKSLELHKKYGPVVRVTPNELAFFTAESFKDIYGFRQGPHKTFKKDRVHYVTPMNGVDNLVSAVDDSLHAKQRRLLAWGFSDTELRKQEALVQGYVEKFIAGLRKASHNSEKVDIKEWFNYTTFDITGDLVFGESFGCLDNSQLHPWINLLFQSIKAINFQGVCNKFPWFNNVLLALMPKSVMQKGIDHFNLGANKVDRRLEMGTERPDILSAVLKNGIIEDKTGYGGDKTMSRAELHSNAFIVIIAGSETSATALSGCIYYLLRTPSALPTLLTEIRSAFPHSSDITFATTAKLPYLNAVIDETLRIYPPFVTGLARVSPSGGETVDGYYIPEGYTVTSQYYATFHSPSNFHAPEEFLPERWLDEGKGDSRFVNDRLDAVNPFSLGARGCLGKSLAYAEMRVILARLLWHFEVELCEESREWTEQEVYFLWEKKPLMVRLRERGGG